MSKVVGTLRREPGTVRRRGREVSWRTRARTRLTTAGVILASVVLPVTNATPATAADGGTYAYVANFTDDSVSVVNTKTNLITDTITTGEGIGNGPNDVVMTPNGKLAYIPNFNAGTVTAIDTATNLAAPGSPITIGPAISTGPTNAAVSPKGDFVYVTNQLVPSVSVIDTATNLVTDTITAGDGIGVGPRGVVVNPLLPRAYVASAVGTVAVIDTTNNSVIDTIASAGEPRGLAVTPDGARLYVTNFTGNSVTVVDTATNLPTPDSPITVGIGTAPRNPAVTPNGDFVYVPNSTSDSVSVIRTSDNTVTDTITALEGIGNNPFSVEVNPAGTFAYVTNSDDDTVSAIDTVTNAVAETFAVGEAPRGLAVGAVPGTGSVPCPVGQVVTGGGAEITGPEPSNFVSKPADEPDNAWEVSLTNPTNQDITVMPYAVCSDPT
ncbi:beta-propeller fold lactonase family protein [Streptomyces sp. NPDC058572]|uniref:beta-propeller fold lactonase family protein n=1 Tax=Streptomyces sp. NPDC058572 TaxID=3346546 RepID=UPI00364A43F7